METKSTTASAAPGAAEAQEQPTLEIILQNVKTDLSLSILFLNAIHSDPDLVESVARFMHGRLLNAQNKPKE